MKSVLLVMVLITSTLANAGEPCQTEAVESARSFVAKDYADSGINPGEITAQEATYIETIEETVYYSVPVGVEDLELNINIGLNAKTCVRVEAHYIVDPEDDAL